MFITSYVRKLDKREAREEGRRRGGEKGGGEGGRTGETEKEAYLPRPTRHPVPLEFSSFPLMGDQWHKGYCIYTQKCLFTHHLSDDLVTMHYQLLMKSPQSEVYCYRLSSNQIVPLLQYCSFLEAPVITPKSPLSRSLFL